MTTLWTIQTWRWLVGAYFWMPLFLRAAVHLGQDYEANLRALEQCGTLIPWNWKTDQWTERSHWCQQDKIQRCHVDVDKLVVWKGSSDHQRQNLRPFRLCSLCGKVRILLNPGREKWMGIGKQPLSRICIESTECRRSSSGKFYQKSPQWESSIRFNRWWENCSVNQRTSMEGSSSSQCWTTLYGMQKEMMNYV